MNLVLTDEQAQIAESARRFVSENSPLERARALRDDDLARRWESDLLTQMGALGWSALTLPEAVGGVGLGLAEFVTVVEALGRNLVPEPLVSSVIFGVELLANAGSSATCERWLGPLIEGRAVAALAAYERGARYEWSRCASTAEASNGGFILRGRKVHALDADGADLLLVTARTAASRQDDGRLTLFAVDARAEGVRIEPERRLDGRSAATVVLDGVHVPRHAVVGTTDGADALLEAALDRALVALAAEAVGGATHALEITLAYVKERRQFGVPVGSFQALQHRLAHVYAKVEMARSAVMAAARAADARAPGAAAFASMAKAKAGEALELASKEGIQMHGGAGMTDEYHIGMFLKRHRGLDATYGDADWHRDRWARLNGY